MNTDPITTALPTISNVLGIQANSILNSPVVHCMVFTGIAATSTVLGYMCAKAVDLVIDCNRRIKDRKARSLQGTILPMVAGFLLTNIMFPMAVGIVTLASYHYTGMKTPFSEASLLFTMSGLNTGCVLGPGLWYISENHRFNKHRADSQTTYELEKSRLP